MLTGIRGLGVVLTLSVGPLACSVVSVEESAGQDANKILFGADDRRDPFEYTPLAEGQQLANASAAWIPATRLDLSNPERIVVLGPTLRERVGLCADERFGEQVTAAECSATLVTPDVVLTAGHCASSANCSAMRVVFGFQMANATALGPLTPADVYSCAEVVTRRYDATSDYAVVRLDRPVQGRTPARVRMGAVPLTAGTPLVDVGTPTGLPLKITSGARVDNPRAATLDFFSSHIDALPGNSGGGVFSKDSLQLVGILSRGPTGSGYVPDGSAGCARPDRAPDDSPLTIDSAYAFRAIADFCERSDDPVLCACGNGTCEAALDETTASCAEDCGSRCGDGVCNGAENGDSCYQDCGSCGNAVCEAREIARLDCCSDCGCPGGFSCETNSCQPQLGNVNGDAVIDQKDVKALGQQLSGARPLPYHAQSADVDCSGAVDAADVAALRGVARGEALRVPCEALEDVATGGSHTCVTLANGAVRCWGAHDFGQLGYGAEPPGPGAREATDVSVGAPVASVVAGQRHTCALTRDGRVKCWGLGAFGQLGSGNSEIVGDDEVPSDVGWVELGRPATKLAAGASFTCAILDDGSVQCWGENSFGQLGYGHIDAIGDDEAPATQPALRFGDRVVELATGADHACARLSTGAVHCWGFNLFGQLGSGEMLDVGDDEPAQDAPAVRLGGAAASISVGTTHSCALLVSGELRCWGDNSYGQLGLEDPMPIGDDESPDSLPAVTIAGATGVAVGDSRTCVLDNEGGVRCFGLNFNGELGYGNVEVQTPGSPALLPRVEIGKPVARVVTFSSHTCALLEDGDLRCFGVNDRGQLGFTHDQAIGDDETPAAAGDVPLTGVNSDGWRFENPFELEVWTAADALNARGNTFAFYVKNSGRQTVRDFRALYLFNGSEGGGRATKLRDESTPWSKPALLLDSPLDAQTLEFDFGSKLLRPCSSTADGKGPERVRLQFNDGGTGWDVSNDYSAADRGALGRFHETDRMQLVNRAGAVIYGYTRPSTFAEEAASAEPAAR